MRSLLTSRLFRCVVCLLLICCVLVQISPLKVKATAVAPAIVKGAVVTGNPYVIVGAMLIALGVMVGTETGAFETVVDNAVSFLDTAGGWIENGTMQLLQTVDSTGQAMYYAAGDLFETLRGWVFSESIFYQGVQFATELTGSLSRNGKSYDYSVSSSIPCSLLGICYLADNDHYYYSTILVSPNDSGIINGSSRTLSFSSSLGLYYLNWQTISYLETNTFVASFPILYNEDVATGFDGALSGYSEIYSTSYDLSLGVLHSTALDGDTYDDAYVDYMRKQLRVINSGGDGGSGEDPDNGGGNNWKWYLPLALAGTAAATYGTTQLQQWTGVSMTDYQVTGEIKEFEILDTPEINGYQGLEISPASGGEAGGDSGSDSGEDTDPTTGSDPDTGGSSNPDAGQDPDTNPDTNPDADPDAGESGDSGDGGSNGSFSSSGSPSGGNFQVDLRNFFPFCIPFDLYKMLSALVAEPIAPVFTFAIPTLDDIYYLEIDLSAWNGVAATVRTCQVALFCVGLVVATRKFIKW